ncbi:MAG: ABC transporter substrate-binding protein [Anaerolineales bacterium]
MKHSRRLLIIIPIAAVIAGCSVSPTAKPPAAAAPTATGTSTAVEDFPDGPITIRDALGNEITFNTPPQRIAVAGRATALIAHSLYMFPEAADRIVAVEDRVQRDLSFYRIVDPNFDDKLLLERNAGPEQIIPSNPDVVLMKSYLAESLGEPIEQLGIPVVYLDLETPGQFERDISVIGKLLGNASRAEEIISFYNSRMAQVAALIDPIPENEYPGVLLIQYSDRGGDVAFNVPSAEWLQTTIVELAGGAPVWLQASQGGGWTIVGFEQIAAWDPQVVMVIYYFDNPATIVESLRADQNWLALKATRNDQLYGFPGDFLSWDQPDPRWILGLQWAATTLHPDETEAIDLKAEISAFYVEMYDLTPATIEDEVFPLLAPEIE